MTRRTCSNQTQPVQVTLAVAATVILLWRSSASEGYVRPNADTSIEIKGRSTGDRYIEPLETLLSVSAAKESSQGVGYAHGNKAPWSVECVLPRSQFADLVAIVLAERLEEVEFVFDRLRRHKGLLLSAEFRARPFVKSA